MSEPQPDPSAAGDPSTRVPAARVPAARVLGVDGGGTKTVARLLEVGPDGRLCVLGSAAAAASNPNSVGWDSAIAAVVQACRGASGDSSPADAAVAAIAGCAAEPARSRMADLLSSAGLARRCEAVADAAPLLAAAPTGQPAIALISGTGSSALARSANGADTLLGGWGYLVGDDGSGLGLGRAAFRWAAQQIDAARADEPPCDPLCQAVLAYAGAADAGGLKGSLYSAPSPRSWLAGLAPVVIRLAEAGDRSASSVVDEGADALADLVLTAAGRVAEPDQPRPRVLLAGGLLERSAYYRRLVAARLERCGWTAGRLTLAPDAATGCGLLAVRLLSR
ncbi:BadF/BadG/BcrA/BcrD ATPase family protein [Botrimarina sp.]|uniref:BadF/BadG/BcrA/BcrD ATPase family protein n=1 Tax=Botrimarina sp. TaxID=2795802 RepID=UPI0032EBAFCE